MKSKGNTYLAAGADWQKINDRFLAASLVWLRQLLVWHIQRDNPGNGQGTEEDVEQAAAEMARAATHKKPPALTTLSLALGLSRYEQCILLLCTAMELDTGIAHLCAQAQGDRSLPYPTFALAMTIFEEPTWDTLSPKRPLRYWHLIEINQSHGQPLVNSALRADERIVNYIKGLNYLDDRLSSFLISDQVVEIDEKLPPSQMEIVDKIVRPLEQSRSHPSLPVVQLLGVDSSSKRLVARHAADALGLTLCRMPAGLLPPHSAELESLARLWHREALLMPLALYLDASEAEEDRLKEGPASPLRRFMAHSGGVLFLDIRDVLADMNHTIALDVVKPTEREQQAAWDKALGLSGTNLSSQLTAQFNLSAVSIRQIARSVLNEPVVGSQEMFDKLWDAALVHTRPRLDTLAQRLTPVATWDDIVLPADHMELLRLIAGQVRQRYIVYDKWGFRRRMNRGLGIVALFAGESGTGKTMASEVIANELKLNLYRIDLSAVVSKYIGETEKNLRLLFDAAEDGGAILFFDEADALFGKRSQVRDSHDRYANIEINYLLQRLEAYRGLAILATNMRAALDEGFVRRLRFIVNFPFPERSDRKRVWQQIFPPETPLAEVDYDRLAGFRMAGGSIHNAALNAAFLAAEAGTPVDMRLLLRSIRMELLKSDRLINEADFLWDQPAD